MSNARKFEAITSLLPLDVLGCTRATLMHSTRLQDCLGLGLYGSLACATVLANAVPFLRHLHMDQLIELKRKLLASLQSSFFLCCARQRCLLLLSIFTLDTPNQTLEPFCSALSLTLLRLSPMALSSRPAFAGTSSTIFLLINTKPCSPSLRSHHDSGQIVPCTCLHLLARLRFRVRANTFMEP